MSNKSGVSEQVISIPKGGGALSGIGETFAPDLHTGTGNFTVPIALPSGRNGFQPELNLIYSTGNGNGPFGLGWRLSVPGVGRKTSKGIPRYRDGAANLEEQDTFILSGAEDLVPVPGGLDGEVQYQPRTETLFARINRRLNARNDYWEVKSKGGLVSRYGTPSARGKDPGVIANPENRKNVFTWQLTETRDPFGNRIDYKYERDLDEEGPHQWDQLYLKQIRYIDYTDGNSKEQFLVTVTFKYAERPDPFSEYRAGFEIRTRRRCTQIAVRTHAGPTRMVRRIHLIYLDQRSDLPDLPELLPRNGLSLLSQVRVEGVDEVRSPGEQVEALPPLEFGYSVFDTAERRYQPMVAVSNFIPERSLGRPEFELVDLFGNGLPDVIQMNGSVRYWRNLGGGCFDFPRTMADAPAAVDLADRGVQMADLDGDGRTDLLVTDGLRGGYYPLTFEGRWNRDGFRPYVRVPSINLEAPDVRLVDLDGDGITDALRTGTSFELYFNDRYAGWQEVELRARGDPETFPNLNLEDPRVKLADLNGDGLQDMVLIHNGRIEYWPYMGYGRWGKRIVMANSPAFEDAAFFPSLGFDPKRTLLGDVDGDGLADLVYVSSGHITVWINQSGNVWSDPIQIDGTPAISDIDAVRLADMLGTGTAGILWTYDQNAQLDSTYKFLDLAGDVKPYLLTKMDNHMGAITHVTYSSSTEFYRKDEVNPATRWKTTLPFPVQVVSRVVVEDYFSRGRLTTEYRYRHGYWDGAEREFRGFGRVEQLDTERFPDGPGGDPIHFTPPLLTKTWFHQGPVGPEFGDWREIDFTDEFWPDDPSVISRPAELIAFLDDPVIPHRIKRDAIRTLRGRVVRTELFALDESKRQDRPYTVAEYQYGVRPEALPEPGEPSHLAVFFPHLAAQRTTQWERGDDPMTQFSFTGLYDEAGQPQQQTRIACPRGWRELDDRPGRPYLATRSRMVYARSTDPEIYILNRPAALSSYEIVNDGSGRILELMDLADNDPSLKVIGQTINFYDGSPFTGALFGEVQRFGALVRSESLVLTDDILSQAYPEGDPTLAGDEPPPYFVGSGAPPWPAAYPAGFTARHPTGQHTDPTRPGLSITPLNYGFASGSAGGPFEAGYFLASIRQRYDFHEDPSDQGRGLLLATRDPLSDGSADRDTRISYDEFDLFPRSVTDPLGLATQVEYDYRVMQPRQVTDTNQNRSEYRFTPFGLLQEIFTRGKSGADEGDRERASTRFEYDLLAFENTPAGERSPIFVRTRRQEHHDTETDVTQPERDAILETAEYSDGFGRLLQTRTQAEDVLFGDSLLDAPLFGNDVLPVDQSDTAGALAPVVGRHREQDDPANVVVSGWQVYDNKGQAVEKFEPFFSKGFEYLSPEAEQALFKRNVMGQKSMLFYDPRGQMIRTVNPDGSEQRVIFGIPRALDNPRNFVPTPWEAYTYDANDLAPLSEGPLADGATGHLTDRAPQHHHFTPAHILIDALGRTLLAVERNRTDTASAIEEMTTRSTYDIRGNLLAVTDPLGREAFRYTYDLANQVLRSESIDAGLRRLVIDAAGNEIERRDGKGALIIQATDVLNRPIRLWARDEGRSPVTLRQRLEYGDGSDLAQPPDERAAGRAANRLGRLHRHYDEAGLLIFEVYDFKGNLLEKARRVIGDNAILFVFGSPAETAPAFRVDWEPLGSDLAGLEALLLDSGEYRTSMAYDGLNRAKRMAYPLDQDGERKILHPRYNRAGSLESVKLDDQVYVERLAYNAKGQRIIMALGNGILTRYAYNPRTFRLARLRSERFTQPNSFTYQPSGSLLQECAYDYDLVGNLLATHDRLPGCGVSPQPDALNRVFGYDSIYRLISATGRECKDLSRPQPENENPPWCGFNSGSHGTPNQDNAPELTRGYQETYVYDEAGNMIRLRHQAQENGNGGGFTRDFTLSVGSNRLSQVMIGNGSNTPPYDYVYDAKGNLISESTSRRFEWDHSDQMKSFRVQASDSEPSVHVQFLYDAGGMRVKKLVRKQGGRFESTIYIDGLFEHHRWQRNGGQAGENNHLHIMDDQQRIALVRVGSPHPIDRGPAVQYPLGDHLASSSIVIDQDGSFVNREEYSPYGETSFGSFSRKRYRFAGQERDEESGLNYHGARYYAPWLGRWVSTDPKGPADGLNLFQFAKENPVLYADPSGTQSSPVGGEDDSLIDPTAKRPPQEDIIVESIDVDEYGTYWRYPSGWSARLLSEGGETLYYEPGSELPLVLDNEGQLKNWVKPEVIIVQDNRSESRRRYDNMLAHKEWSARSEDLGKKPSIWQQLYDPIIRETPSASGELWLAFTASLSSVKIPKPTFGPPASVASADAVLFRLRDQATELTRKLGARTPAEFGSYNDAIFKSLVKEAIEKGELPPTIRTSPASLNQPGSAGIDVWDTATGTGWDLTTARSNSVISHDIRYLNSPAPDGTVINDVRPLVYTRQ